VDSLTGTGKRLLLLMLFGFICLDASS